MKRDKSILGIHLDNGSLSIVHLRRTAEGLEVCGSAVEPLHDRTEKDDAVVSAEVIAQKIRTYCRANKCRSSKVVIAPSCAEIVLKPSESTGQTDEQIQKQVRKRIEKYTWFGSEEIVFDYCRVDEGSRLPNKQIVLEAISTKRISDFCFDVARKAGLELVRIEPVVLPMMKLVCDVLTDESCGVSVLLALGSKSGNISVLEGALPRLCRNLNVGVENLSEDEGSIDCLKDQLKSVLEFSRSLAESASAQIVLRVAANCGLQQLREIAAKIQQEFGGIIVTQISTTELTELYDLKATDTEELPVFAFALALAECAGSRFSWELDLLSQNSLARYKVGRELSLTAKTAILIFLLAFAAKFPFNMKTNEIEAACDEIERKNANVMSMAERIASMSEQVAESEKMEALYTLSFEKMTGIPWPQLLENIANAVPDNVRIVSISTASSEHILLKGEAWTESDVRSFEKELQKSDLVESTKIESIRYNETDTYVSVNYEIVCKAGLPD